MNSTNPHPRNIKAPFTTYLQTIMAVILFWILFHNFSLHRYYEITIHVYATIYVTVDKCNYKSTLWHI